MYAGPSTRRSGPNTATMLRPSRLRADSPTS